MNKSLFLEIATPLAERGFRVFPLVPKVWRACHLGTILIETLAREALGRQIRQALGTC
jgi:hypothetical protein